MERALYGLPISPRLWAKKFSHDLTEKLGWQECKHEPGVYKKVDKSGELVALMTVYVDDCILGGCDLATARRELAAIHALHPITGIATTTDKEGNCTFDMCGSDVTLNPSKRTLSISMSKYATKLLKRFDMSASKGRSNPSFPEANLYAKSGESSFPYRACVGALQWLVSQARPDLAHSVNMLARASSRPVTNSMAKCARLVMQYLQATKDMTIDYSPQIEAEFVEKAKTMAEHPDNAKKDPTELENPVHTYSDASFGCVYATLRSVTGAVIYLHGTPIAWTSKVQSVFASSTSQSEWIALSSGIELEQSVYALQDFFAGETTPRGPLWCDARSVVISGRKGTDDLESLAVKSRHVALRWAKVLPEAARLWFTTTDMQRADGVTKSCNSTALRHLFLNDPKPPPELDDLEDDDDMLDLVDAYVVFAGEQVRRSALNRDLRTNVFLS